MELLVAEPTSLNQIINILSNSSDRNCVSIIISTKNQNYFTDKLKTKLKNEIRSVEKLIREKKLNEYDEHIILQKLYDLTDQIKFNRNTKSIGIFVSKSIAEIVHFPFELKSKTILDESFEVRDIILTMHKFFRYNLLLISKKKIRLINGFGLELEENSEIKFYHEPEEKLNEGKSKGFDPGRQDIIELRNNISLIDGLIKNKRNNKLPIIIFGDIKAISYFKKFSAFSDKIIFEKEGNFDNTSISQLKSKIKNIIDNANKIWDEKLFRSIKKDIDSMNYVSGLQDVWTSIMMNSAKILIIEKDYRVSGWTINNDLFLVYDKPGGGAKYHEDVVDDMAETVFKKGGEVYFVENGRLKLFDRVLLITR